MVAVWRLKPRSFEHGSRSQENSVESLVKAFSREFPRMARDLHKGPSAHHLLRRVRHGHSLLIIRVTIQEAGIRWAVTGYANTLRDLGLTVHGYDLQGASALRPTSNRAPGDLITIMTEPKSLTAQRQQLQTLSFLLK